MSAFFLWRENDNIVQCRTSKLKENNAVGTGPSSKSWERMLTAVAAAAANLYAQLARR